MSEEGKAIEGNGGKGSGKGAKESSNDITKITESIDTMKGVMGDLVTKVSEIERSAQERTDYEAIMRNMGGGDDEPPKSVQTEGQEKNMEDMSKTELANHIASSLSKTFQGQLDTIIEGVNKMGAKFEIKHLSQTEPDFEKSIRPRAYQISKREGMEGLSPTILSNIAKGELALESNKKLTSDIADMQKKLNELSNAAGGDKPGFFVGVTEPEKEMDMDESFNDACDKAGLP